jgi:hypothetical protein
MKEKTLQVQNKAQFNVKDFDIDIETFAAEFREFISLASFSTLSFWNHSRQ